MRIESVQDSCGRGQETSCIESLQDLRAIRQKNLAHRVRAGRIEFQKGLFFRNPKARNVRTKGKILHNLGKGRRREKLKQNSIPREAS